MVIGMGRDYREFCARGELLSRPGSRGALDLAAPPVSGEERLEPEVRAQGHEPSAAGLVRVRAPCWTAPGCVRARCPVVLPDASARPDAAVDDVVHGHGARWSDRQAGDGLVVDDDVAGDHAVHEPGRQLGQVEPVLRLVLGERRLSGEDRPRRRQAEHSNVVRVLGDEALEVVCVVGVVLALDGGFGSAHAAAACVTSSNAAGQLGPERRRECLTWRTLRRVH